MRGISYRRAHRVVLGALSLGLALSCSTTTAPNQHVCAVGELGLHSMSISSGVTPTFTWSPACTVDILSVYDSFVTVWSISNDSTKLGSPVTYGIVPAGSTQHFLFLQALQAGVTYRVRLNNLNGSSPGGFDTIGEWAFVP